MATQNIFNLTDTWNNVATTFTAIKMNVTDTASAAASLLMDLQVGGVSRFRVGKNGKLTVDTDLPVSKGGRSSAEHNIAIGKSALNRDALALDFNVAVGSFAMEVANAERSTAIGYGAFGLGSPSYSVAIGFGAGSRANANFTTAVGYNCATNFATANNTAVGHEALRGSNTVANNTANNTVAVGFEALAGLTSGLTNTALGYQAGKAVTTGGGNTVFGSLAGTAVTTGANNTFVGDRAGSTVTTGSTNIVIGQNLAPDSTTGSNQINIGSRYFHDRLSLLERAADPAKPAEGNMIVWLSDGTGLGDDGDVIIASTAGGVTNYAILFDHSGGTLWP